MNETSSIDSGDFLTGRSLFGDMRIDLDTRVDKIIELLENLHAMIRHGDGFETCADITDKSPDINDDNCGMCKRLAYCEADVKIKKLLKELKEEDK